jgi:hypothetical protein
VALCCRNCDERKPGKANIIFFGGQHQQFRVVPKPPFVFPWAAKVQLSPSHPHPPTHLPTHPRAPRQLARCRHTLAQHSQPHGLRSQLTCATQPKLEHAKGSKQRQAAIDEARKYLHLDDPGAALFRDFFCDAETSSVRDDDDECDDDERSWVSHATKAAVRLHMPPASAGRDGWSAAIVRRVRYTHLGKHAEGAQRELALEVEYADHTADEFVLPHDAADVRTLFYYSSEPARALGVPAIFSRNQWSQEFEFIWQQARCTLRQSAAWPQWSLQILVTDQRIPLGSGRMDSGWGSNKEV